MISSVPTSLAVLAVCMLGLSAGAMLAEGAVLVPYWRSLPPGEFLRWYAANATRLFDFFGPLEIAALATSAVASVACRRRAGGRLLVVAALLAVAVLVPFPLYFQAVNASFEAGTIAHDAVGAELARWATWHWVRTAIGVAAFVAGALALGGRRV
jgi:hypothetical protein